MYLYNWVFFNSFVVYYFVKFVVVGFFLFQKVLILNRLIKPVCERFFFLMVLFTITFVLNTISCYFCFIYYFRHIYRRPYCKRSVVMEIAIH